MSHWHHASLLAGLLLLAAPVLAQESEEKVGATEAEIQRVFTIHYLDMEDITVLLSRQLEGGGLVTIDNKTRSVILQHRPDVVERIERWLAEIDVPPQAAVVRVLLEKAERKPSQDAERFQVLDEWTRTPLAETTLEVKERSEVTQAFGPDGVYEVRVKLSSVDRQREMMIFDELAIAHFKADEDGGTRRRQLLRTSLDLRDRTPKTVMSASSSNSDVALVVRVVGVLRDDDWKVK
ncbi:MAG: secretin N-terminal domain-containing protein [Acidobacteriota bacterium]